MAAICFQKQCAMNIMFFSALIIGSGYGHSYKFRVRYCGQGADWD